MSTGIIVFIIIISSGILGVLIFFLIRIYLLPKKIGTLDAHIQQGKIQPVIKSAKQILAKNPRNVEAHYLLGKAYAKDGRTELALMEYKAINKIGIFEGICKEVPFRKEIASLYLQFGQEEEALKEYILLTKKEPFEAQHFYNVGKLFEARNKSKQAVGYYKKALELNPRFSDGWFALGQLLLRAKRLNDAKEAFTRALKLQPDNYKAYFYLGRLLKDSKDYAGALKAFENAQKDQEFKAKALIERGSIYLANQNYSSAARELERAIKLLEEKAQTSNDLLFARYFLSICHEKTRNIDKAIEQWEKIYAKNKAFRDVAEKLSRYQELRADDRIKDFITESPEAFEKTCKKIANAMHLAVTDYMEVPDGCQMTTVDQDRDKWRNTRKFPKFLRILRTPEIIDLGTVRNFYEKMKVANVIHGYILTSSEFSRSAYEFAESRPIDLLPKEKLQELLHKTDNAEEKK